MSISTREKNNIARTKKAFYDAFLDLMESNSFESISATSIIKKSGYSRSAFYTYFYGKYDLVEKYIISEAAALVEALCSKLSSTKEYTYEDDIFYPGLFMFEHVLDNRRFYQNLIHDKITGYNTDMLAKKFATATQALLELNYPEDIKQKLDMDLYCFITADSYISFIKFWDKNNYSYTPEELARKMMYNFVRTKKINGVSIKQLPPDFNLSSLLL